MKTASLRLRFAGLFALAALWPGAALAAPGFSASSATLTCDFLEYRSSEGVILARGNAVLLSQGNRLEADALTLHRKTQAVEMEGNIVMEDGGVTLLAESGRFDAEAGTGTFVNGYIVMPPWRLWAHRVVRLSSSSYRMERAAVTSCEHDPPHYHVRMSRLDLTPGKEATARWPRMLFEDVTVAGVPYYRKVFREKPWSFTVDPGHSGYHGYIAKNAFIYRLTPSGTARLYWDHFELTGNGWGAEYTHFSPKVQGSVYGYRIKDRVAKTERWNGRVAHWQSLTPRLSLQVNALAESDASFNNFYFRDDPQRVRLTARSNASMAYQHPAFTARLSTQHDRMFDPVRGAFVRQRTILPEASFQTAALEVASRTYVSWGASFRNQYERPLAAAPAANPILPGKDVFLRTGDTTLSLRRLFLLGKKATLEPSAGISENWRSWSDDGLGRDPRDIFQGRGFTGLNFRYRPTRSLDYDLSHAYRVRWSPNQFKRDHSNPADQGLEENLIRLHAGYRRGSLWARLGSGYDLRDRLHESIETPRQKTLPPSLDLNYSPVSWFSLSYQESFLLYPVRRPQYTQGSFRLGRGDVRFTSGFSYNVGAPGRLQLRHGALFDLTRGWHAEGNVRYVVEGDGRLRYERLPKNLVEREVVLRRDLHCWSSRISLRQRPGLYEVYVRIDLMTNMAARRRLSSPEESQYYPGRPQEN